MPSGFSRFGEEQVPSFGERLRDPHEDMASDSTRMDASEYDDLQPRSFQDRLSDPRPSSRGRGRGRGRGGGQKHSDPGAFARRIGT